MIVKPSVSSQCLVRCSCLQAVFGRERTRAVLSPWCPGRLNRASRNCVTTDSDPRLGSPKQISEHSKNTNPRKLQDGRLGFKSKGSGIAKIRANLSKRLKLPAPGNRVEVDGDLRLRQYAPVENLGKAKSSQAARRTFKEQRQRPFEGAAIGTEDEFGRRPVRPITDAEIKRQEPAIELSAREREVFSQMAETNNTLSQTSSVRSSSQLAKTSAGAISLLEELFPRELSRKAQSKKTQERHIPRRPLASLAPDEVELPKGQDTLFSDTEMEQVKQGMRRLSNQVTVVVLRKASKHLTEHDFRRAMPGGRHIGAWSKQGDLIKVMRSRHYDTLESKRDYFLVFSNSTSAHEYVDHVNTLHRHTKVYSPRSMFAPIPPPPQLNVKTREAKFKDVVYTYTLLPPSQSLSLRMLPQPFSPIFRDIIASGGVPKLREGRSTDYEVLLWSEDCLMDRAMVERAIMQDGRHRGAFWSITPKDHGLRILDLDVNSGLETNGRPSDATLESKRLPGYMIRKFVVSLTNEQEAIRFALAWHRKDVTPVLSSQLGRDWKGNPVICNAELVW